MDMLAGTWIIAGSVPGLPVGIFLTIAGDRLFSDRAGAGCCFPCHGVFLLSVDTLAQICYNKRAQGAYNLIVVGIALDPVGVAAPAGFSVVWDSELLIWC